MSELLNIRMPDGTVIRNVPKGTPRETVQAAYEKLSGKTPPQETPQDATVGGEAVKAVKRGLVSSGALFVEGIPAVLKSGAEMAFGGDWGGEEQTQKLAKALQDIDANPELKAAIGSYEDIKSPYDAALYFANAAQMLPDLAGSLGAGSLVKMGVKKALTEGTEQLSKKAALASMGAGAATYNQAVMTPSELASIYQETGKIRPDLALGSAAVQNVGETASDLLLGGQVGKEIAGRGLKQILKAAGEGAVTEGLTEGAQALVSEGAQEIADPDKATFDGKGVIDQTLLGAAGGAGVKGTLQGLTGGKAPKSSVEGFTPPEEVTPVQAPEKSSTELPTPPLETLIAPELTPEERPTPPIDAYEADANKRKRKKQTPAQVAEEIRQEMVQTPLTSQTLTLPQSLSGAKPRFGFGTKNFGLNFKSDVDKALFITSQEKKSKSDKAYRTWLKNTVKLTDSEITSQGAKIRSAIKGLVESNLQSTEDNLSVEPLFKQATEKIKQDTSAPVRNIQTEPFTDKVTKVSGYNFKATDLENTDQPENILNTEIRPERKELQVKFTNVPEEHRGKGVATQLYRQAINIASEQGLTLTSDDEVSADAQRIYKSLEKQGYIVEKHPKVVVNEETGRLLAPLGEPVFRVLPKPDSIDAVLKQQADQQENIQDTPIEKPQKFLQQQQQAAKQDSQETADEIPQVNPLVTSKVSQPIQNLLVNSGVGNGLNKVTNSILNIFNNSVGKSDASSRTRASQNYLVIEDSLTGNLDEMYLPDVFRGIFRNGDVIPQEVRNLLLNKPMFKKSLEALRSLYNLNKNDLKSFSLMDILSEVYTLHEMKDRVPRNTDRYRSLDAFVADLPETYKKAFKFINAVKAQIAKDLTDKAGISSVKELTQESVDKTKLINDLREIRLEAAKETLAERDLGEAFATDPVLPLGDKRNTTVGGMLGRVAMIPRYIARYSPAFAQVNNAANERREAITGYRHLFFEGAKKYFVLVQKSPEKAEYIGNILNEQRLNKSKATLNPETGFLEFKRKNKETGKFEKVILKDAGLSEIYIELQQTFSKVPEIHRTQLRRSFASIFAKANLGFNPTEQQFNQYKKLLKDKKVAKENQLSEAQLAEVEQYFETSKGIDLMLSRDYIPHTRFGTRGGTLKDPKTGKNVWFGVFKTDNHGRPDKESFKEYEDSLAEFKAQNPEYSEVAASDTFDLSIDNISRQLGSSNKAMTLELLSQLLNSSNSKLFKEYEQQNRITQEQLVKGRLTGRGFMKYLEETDENPPEGYSKDWPRVISAYFNSAAYFLGNMENEPKLLVANSRLKNDTNASQYLKNYSDKYVNSILDPEENYAGLRELQYMYAMGLNPSSALLQFQSLFTYMPAVLTLATNSNIQSVANLVRAARVVPLFFDTSLTSKSKTHESLFAFGDKNKHEELIKKGKITRKQSDAILQLYNAGSLQALRSGDMIGVPSDVSTRGNKGKWARRRNDAAAGAGIMMRTTEEMTRGIQALAAIYSLEDPKNLTRLHENLKTNDEVYKVKLREKVIEEPDVAFMAQFLVDKALGQYGKEARSPLQNSGASVTLIPFSTYPVQMLVNTAEFISGKYGPEGKKAAIWAIASTGAIGGLKAIPAALFIKELVEFLIVKILGEDRDLEEEFKKGASAANIPDWITRILSNGVFSELFGVDISSRMAVDVPLGTELLKYAQGEQQMSVTDMLGVQGSILESPMKGYDKLMEGASAKEVLASTIPNVAIQNLLKAGNNTSGVTYRNMPSLTKEEGSEVGNIVKRGLGFKPMEQANAEKTINELRREEVRYKPALDRFKAKLNSSIKKELLSDDPQAREEAAVLKQEVIRDMIAFMQEKEFSNIGQRVRSLIQEARLDAYGRLDGLEGMSVRKRLTNTARKSFEEIYEAND